MDAAIINPEMMRVLKEVLVVVMRKIMCVKKINLWNKLKFSFFDKLPVQK